MPIRLRVGELARQQGLTIKALAARAGIAYNTAHTLYTGRATRIDLDTLDRICTALGVEPGEMFIRFTAAAPQHRPDTAQPGGDAQHAVDQDQAR
jgi:putative transcriptional regulator